MTEASSQVAINFHNLSFVDSPLQNLALLKDALDGTSVLSTVGMVNGYFEPLTHSGQRRRFQPFLTGGIGMARNEMSDWTRTNPAAGRVTRTFEGDTTTGFAWSLGFGVTAELNVGRQPVFLEASYRYFDLGSAEGSDTPLPGNGVGSAPTLLRFGHREHVISVGLRVPLGRF